MRDFNEKNKYDYVLNLFTSFGYFETEQENKKVFQNIEKALKKGGYFILDFFNKEKIIRNLQPLEVKEINNIIFKLVYFFPS